MLRGPFVRQFLEQTLLLVISALRSRSIPRAADGRQPCDGRLPGSGCLGLSIDVHHDPSSHLAVQQVIGSADGLAEDNFPGHFIQ